MHAEVEIAAFKISVGYGPQAVTEGHSMGTLAYITISS